MGFRGHSHGGGCYPRDPPPLVPCRRPNSAPRGSSAQLPPSPWALPLIGHLHHLASCHGPPMLLRLGRLPVIVASSADATHEVMRTRDLDFTTRPLTGMACLGIREGPDGIIFGPYGDVWRQVRKICTVELLSPRRVQCFRPVREEEAGRLLRAVASAQPDQAVNSSELLAVYAADSSPLMSNARGCSSDAGALRRHNSRSSPSRRCWSSSCSILEYPSVSRVMREASFSSAAVPIPAGCGPLNDDVDVVLNIES
ncbi:hypothetical protein EJB05_51758, partial [Eragrostis curvula]